MQNLLTLVLKHPTTKKMTKTRTTIISTADAFAKYLRTCESTVVFDSEDMGLAIESPIIGFSFWDFKNDPVFAITNNLFEEGMPEEEFVAVCNKYFHRLRAIGHNIKFDLGITKQNGIVDIPLECDTSSMVHLYNPDLRKKLETRVGEDLGYEKETYEQIMGKKWPKDHAGWFDYVKKGIITLKSMSDYAGEDAYWTGQLYNHYSKLLTDDMWRIMEEIEIPLIYTLRDMHYKGVNVDGAVLSKLDVELDAEINRLQTDIYEEAGAVFNLKSPKQVGEILFDKLGLPSHKETASGARSTDTKVLKILAKEGYRVAELMVEYSSVKTLSQNFVKSIPNLVSPDGRLRCSFNIDIARTGRLSSNNPNLQNQPNNKKFPVRTAYIPTGPGWKLLVADLSQIELRVMAHVSGDRRLSEAFHAGADIHQAVADQLSITRDQAKVINFAIIYGMGPDSLAATLGIPRKEAVNIIKGYESNYPGFYKWKVATEKLVERHKMVTNIFGRIRRFKYIHGDPRSYYGALRQGVNTVVQGSAADIIKINMIHAHKEYTRRNMKSSLLLTVHDELVVDCPEQEIEEAYSILMDCMENSIKLDVPIIAEGKVVNTWHDMKDKSFVSLLPNYQTLNFPHYILNTWN